VNSKACTNVIPWKLTRKHNEEMNEKAKSFVAKEKKSKLYNSK